MRTARFSDSGGSPYKDPSLEIDPLGRDPPARLDRDSPEGIWDQAARQEVTSYRDPPWTDKHLSKKLPCPKLRLQVVKIKKEST